MIITSLLRRPLWEESPADREYRVGRLLFAGPAGAMMGLVSGILAAQRWELEPLAPALAGGMGGFLVMYLLGQLDSLLLHVAARRGPATAFLARVGATLGVGAFLGGFVGRILGADALASLFAGSSLLLVTTVVAPRFFWGGWVEGIVGILTGQGGVSRPPDHSSAAAHIARGDVKTGLALYERAHDESPSDPTPLLHAAWTLRAHGHPREALDWFRRARALPALEPDRARMVDRQIRELEDGPAGGDLP